MDLFGKKKAQDLRARVWEFEEFENFFSDEMKKSGNSSLFKNVSEAFQEFAALRAEPINLESAKKVVAANDKLMEACRAYSQARRGAVSSSGRERLAVIDSLFSYQDGLNIDQMRDVRKIKEYEGDSWEKALVFDMAEIKLEDTKGEIVGNQVNQRLKVNYQGKTGFFTEERELLKPETRLRRVIDKIDKKTNPVLRKIMEDNFDWMKEDSEKGIGDNMLTHSGTSSLLGEQWFQMDDHDPKKADMAGLIADFEKLDNVSLIAEKYQEKLKAAPAGLGAAGKERLMRGCIEENCMEGIQEICYRNMDVLMNLPDLEENKKEPNLDYRTMKRNLISIRAGLKDEKQMEVMEQVIRDGALAYELSNEKIMAAGDGTAIYNIRAELDQGNELTSRNVATSRIAELLGVGHMVAHSEKMRVSINGTVKTGCFMEFAKGLDLSSRKEEDLALIEQTEFTYNASFLKDMCSMEALDFLCGQNDRHGRNMFMQLSEPDANGKRTIVGLQGIDNDLSFGEKEYLSSFHQGDVKDMTFISQEMAQNIAKLDRDTLEFALGDIIPQKQIDVMAKRVQIFQDHMKEKMVLVEPEEWKQVEKLVNTAMESKGKISEDMVQERTGKEERKKGYVNGVLNIYNSSLRKVGTIHKDMSVKNTLKNVKEEVAKVREERAKKPQKTAVSFAELQRREQKARPKREPKVIIGKRPEKQVAKGPEDAEKKQQGMVK